MKKAIFYTIAFIAIEAIISLCVMGVYCTVTGKSFSTAGSMMMVLTLIITNLIIGGVFLLFKLTPVSGSYIRIRPWSVLFWTVLAALGSIIPSLWFQDQLPELPNLMENDFKAIINTPGGFLGIAILGPIAEEIVFRGAVLRELLKRSSDRHWSAIAISALLFALVHVNPAQMPHAFLMGLLLGWLYYRTDSIIPCIVFHVVNNTVAFVIEKLYPNLDDGSMLELFGGNERAAVLSVVFSLFIVLPAIYQLSWRMRKASDPEVS